MLSCRCLSLKKISLYVHIPFCERKCLYCDFLSFSASEETKKEYVRALIRQTGEAAPAYKDFQVKTIFFGGGTPSVLPGGDIIDIMDAIRENFDVDKSAEVSIEINPGTAYDLNSYKKAGITRLSIGLQSADDGELIKLGRIHRLKDFEALYEQVLSAGFDNVNVDLMSGIPGQTLASFEKSLRYLAEGHERPRPAHISAYSLSVEEGTPFSKMDLDLPDEDTEREMYKITSDILSQYGYGHYEISNYALEGYECEHNKVYWKRGNYLGLGLGASSMVDNVRWKNTDIIEDFIKKDDFDKKSPEQLSVEDQMEEFMFLGLRMRDGVSIDGFREYFNAPMPPKYEQVIEKYISLGLLKKERNCVMLTHDGINVSNMVMSEFIF